MKCKCGCGREVPTRKDNRGRKRMYFSRECNNEVLKRRSRKRTLEKEMLCCSCGLQMNLRWGRWRCDNKECAKNKHQSINVMPRKSLHDPKGQRGIISATGIFAKYLEKQR